LKSIRRDLLVWLVLALAGGMVVVMAATYAFAYAQITRVFDEEMVKVAQAAHFGEDWRGPGRVRIPHPGFNLSVRAYDHAGTTLFETPPPLPAEVPLLYESGLRVLGTGAGKWRIYTHATPEGVVQVAQPESTRTSLARSLSLRMALPELVLIPLFVLFMAWVVRRGLAPLMQVTRRVEERDASRLEPLPADDVPLELKPLIAEINAAYRPALIVLDGVAAFTTGGPERGTTVASEVVLAGTDRVAIDAVGVALLRLWGTTPDVSAGPILGQLGCAEPQEHVLVRLPAGEHADVGDGRGR
jgi:hypothetical protein